MGHDDSPLPPAGTSKGHRVPSKPLVIWDSTLDQIRVETKDCNFSTDEPTSEIWTILDESGECVGFVIDLARRLCKRYHLIHNGVVRMADLLMRIEEETAPEDRSGIRKARQLIDMYELYTVHIPD